MAKQAVVICSYSTVACMVQWYDYVCHCLQKPSLRDILNAEISQFCQRLGLHPQTPASGIAYYSRVKLELPF